MNARLVRYWHELREGLRDGFRQGRRDAERRSPRGEQRAWPLSGVAIVFRRQMRGRNAWRDLIGVAINLIGLLAIAALFQSVWLATRTEYNNDVPHFLLRWQITLLAGATI